MELNHQRLAQDAMKTLVETLETLEWTYEVDKEDPFRLETGGVGDDMPISLVVRVDPQRLALTLLSPIDVTVPEDKGAEVAFALAIINDNLAFGNFDFHMDNGSIWFRNHALFRDATVTQDLCHYLMMLSIHVVDTYNDKLLMLINGLMDLNELLAFIEED